MVFGVIRITLINTDLGHSSTTGLDMALSDIMDLDINVTSGDRIGHSHQHAHPPVL